MEPETLAQLVDQHAAALVLYARQWCAAAEDVVQDALIKLAGQRPVPRNVNGWLYHVVRNAAISAGRAEARRRKHEARAARTRNWFHPSEITLDTEEVTRALVNVPLELREIIIAHVWGGLTFEEIAAVAGCSSSTAHRRYLSGLAHLRERLGVACLLVNPGDKNH